MEDRVFEEAIDSFSPGIQVDVKSLRNCCLAFRDFPPVATGQMVKDACGATIAVQRVLPERTESGTVTGLCYAELASEADARRAMQLLKDGILIAGRAVKVALLPRDELETCARNLERLRGVIPASSFGVGVAGESPISPGGGGRVDQAVKMNAAAGPAPADLGYHDGPRRPNGMGPGSFDSQSQGDRKSVV